MRKEGKRKALAALVCGSMLTVALVGGTLAYLSDTDSDVNVMTLGNVKIKQHEQQYADDGQTLEPFVQGKELYPGTKIDKIVTVENTGKSDVYFRTLIAFEDIESETFDIGFPISDGYAWSWAAPEATIELGGTTYQVYEAVYKGVLPAGETSPASLTRVELSATSTNEDMAELGDTYEVLVLSQAVQTAGFADAETALNESFGEVNAKNATEWFKGMEAPVLVATADDLTEALAAGNSVALTDDITLSTAMTVSEKVDINLNGHELSVVGLDLKNGGSLANGTVSSAGNTSMIPHLKVSGGTLEMDGVSVKILHYLNFVASGSRSYAEFTGLEVANATVVLDDCDLYVSNDTYRTWNYVYGIAVNNGNVTMNGGSLVVSSAGAASTDLKTAISAMGNSDATLNGVNVQAETYGTTMGHLIVNTTDKAVSEGDFVSFGGTYELNHIS